MLTHYPITGTTTEKVGHSSMYHPLLPEATSEGKKLQHLDITKMPQFHSLYNHYLLPTTVDQRHNGRDKVTCYVCQDSTTMEWEKLLQLKGHLTETWQPTLQNTEKDEARKDCKTYFQAVRRIGKTIIVNVKRVSW